MSTHPWKTILISVIITGLFCIGAGVNFTETNDNSVIWVPADSDFLAHKRYVESAYPSTTRFFYLIFVSSNVMSAATTRKVNQIIDVPFIPINCVKKILYEIQDVILICHIN